MEYQLNPIKGRILALDLGKRRIGLALSDPLGITAQGLPTLERTNIRADLAALAKLIDDWGVTVLLMGNPIHMSGKERPASRLYPRFRGPFGGAYRSRSAVLG